MGMQHKYLIKNVIFNPYVIVFELHFQYFYGRNVYLYVAPGI